MINETQDMTNGRAAAAILSAAIGCAALGLLQCGAEVSKTLGKALLFSPGSGALSGETTIAICIWLLCWLLLAKAWKYALVNLDRINAVSACLLIVGALLTFPPVDNAFARILAR